MRRRWPPEGGQPPSPHAAARRAATSAGTARIRANERGHGLGMGGTGVHPTGFRTTPPNVLHVICRFTVMADRGVLQRSRRAGWGGRSARYPLLGGRYAVRSLVGEGGMSEVMSALDTVLDRPVAVKILREHLAHDPIAVARFRREARAVAALSHPNIVAIHDVGAVEREQVVDGRRLAPGRPYLVTELVVGQPLDLGIALAPTWTPITDAGRVHGTAEYLSPEQARGDGVDGRSDLYSLGVVLYELLTGRVPFTGDNAVAVALQHLEQRPEPIRSFRPDVPLELERVVLRCLEKDAAGRYASAGTLRAALAAARGAASARAAGGL